jgi:hypothetical protein
MLCMKLFQMNGLQLTFNVKFWTTNMKIIIGKGNKPNSHVIID